jgi:serpin B
MVALPTAKELIVMIPRFTIRARYDLIDALRALGISEAFAPFGADFTGMGLPEHTFISEVAHEALIDVDERGTEAAAALLWVTASASRPSTITSCSGSYLHNRILR